MTIEPSEEAILKCVEIEASCGHLSSTRATMKRVLRAAYAIDLAPLIAKAKSDTIKECEVAAAIVAPIKKEVTDNDDDLQAAESIRYHQARELD